MRCYEKSEVDLQLTQENIMLVGMEKCGGGWVECVVVGLLYISWKREGGCEGRIWKRGFLYII